MTSAFQIGIAAVGAGAFLVLSGFGCLVGTNATK